MCACYVDSISSVGIVLRNILVNCTIVFFFEIYLIGGGMLGVPNLQVTRPNNTMREMTKIKIFYKNTINQADSNLSY